MGPKGFVEVERYSSKRPTSDVEGIRKKSLLDTALTGIVNLVFWTHQRAVELGKSISPWMVKQVLKSAQFTWRRVRKSLKSKRDAGLFEFFKAEIEHLCLEAEQGRIRLWFYDESGFNLNPNTVYAWLPTQNQAKDVFLPAQRGNVMTVAGFLSTDNTLEAYSQKGAMDSAAFIAYVDHFITQQIKDTSVKNIVVIDNASFHKSAIVKQKMKTWNQQNLFFQFLPPYCSELNRIEILWRRIKQNWLEIMDYDSADTLEKAVVNIIKLYNSKYSITFC